MRSTIQYEWVAEPMDKYDDIIDPIFCDTYIDARKYKVADFDGCVKIEIGLVRNLGNDEDGLLDRQYAYSLDTEFDGGAKIPKRFLKERG